MFEDEFVLSVGGMSNYLDLMGMCWIGEDDMVTGPMAKLAAVQNHMGSTFFPVFINTSNEDPAFFEEAKHTAAELEKMGVPYELLYRSQEETGELHHGYLELFETNPTLAECLKRMLSFLKTHMNGSIDFGRQ